jgi:hypothetical protein
MVVHSFAAIAFSVARLRVFRQREEAGQQVPLVLRAASRQGGPPSWAPRSWLGLRNRQCRGMSSCGGSRNTRARIICL